MCRLVVEVATLVGDVDVHPRDFLTCFQPTMRTLRPPRQLALGEPQPSLGGSEVTRLAISAPSLKTANVVSPTSMPTARSLAGNGCGSGMSTLKRTYQRSA